MGVWTGISLIGAAVGIVGLFVSNWAENHPAHKAANASTRPHDLALSIGLIGWGIAAISLVVDLIHRFGE